jgi:hypothetical protein
MLSVKRPRLNLPGSFVVKSALRPFFGSPGVNVFGLRHEAGATVMVGWSSARCLLLKADEADD